MIYSPPIEQVRYIAYSEDSSCSMPCKSLNMYIVKSQVVLLHPKVSFVLAHAYRVGIPLVAL